MRFIQTGNHIECLRELEDEERLISTFDASLDEIPPHIQALLSSAELAELNAWLKDFRHIHDTHTEELVYETVCEMIEKVCAQIESREPTPVEHIEKLEMLAIRLLIAIKNSDKDVDAGEICLDDKLQNMDQKDKLRTLLSRLSEEL